MSEFNPDVLSVIGEAVIIVRGGKIVFSNAPADEFFGGSVKDKRLSEVFGSDISGTQAADFSASVSLNGKNCVIRSSRKYSEQILVISEVKADLSVINDAFLYSLRSSLMVMSMSAERCRMLAEENGNEDMLSTADALNKSLSSATRLMANISAVRAIEEKALCFTPKTVNLSSLLAQYVDVAAALLPEVKVSLEAPDSVQASVDTDLIKHLFTNLISNSVLHGKCKKLRVRLIDGAQTVLFSVSDNGHGIKNDELYNVFERYLSNAELSEINRGAGFGLTVVMGIARLHGGTVLLESREGHGTTVSVSLRKNLNSAALCSDTFSPEDVRDILTGLADCVDEKRFRETYQE